MQHTIKNTISVLGKGLHTGKPVRLTLKSAPVNTGRVFRRVDLNPAASIAVTPDKVEETALCTQLVEGNVKVTTIEHILSALSALEIDNIYLELDAEEVPILDGSSSPFVFMLQSAGKIEQTAPRKYLKIKKPVRIDVEGKFVELSPHNDFALEISIDFAHPAIAKSSHDIKFNFSPNGYVKEISRARTFGFVNDLEKLHSQGLALGATLENAVGLSDNGIVNPEGLRYPDEFVKHKLLDAVGDLYVAGPIKGQYRGYKPGHSLNNRLLRKVLSDKDAFEYIE